MQKISFSDKYGLNSAVLKGWKDMTRRIIPEKNYKNLPPDEVESELLKKAKYKPGEIVAVAQSLKEMGYDPKKKDWKSGHIWGLDRTAAWTNKMFVFAFQCVHQIRITNVRVERLQDITEEDAVREGVEYRGDLCGFITEADNITYDSARDAFATLIDKISGKGTWEKNPLVYVYKFSLIR